MNANLNEDRNAIQLKTFTRWVNTHLLDRQLRIDTLATGFQDGVMLINLLEIISNKKIAQYNKKPKNKYHRLENLKEAINFITKEGLTLVNIAPDDVEAGSPRGITLTLGLTWTLILRYHINKGEGEGMSKDALMKWVNEQIKPYGQVTKDFTTSYKNPKVISALCDSLRKGTINVDQVSDETAVEDAQRAIDIASQSFGIPPVVDGVDMINCPDDLSIMCYVSYYRDAVRRLNEAGKIKISDECDFSFTVTAKDAQGNTLITGGDDFIVTITGANGEVPLATTDNKDGSYTATYRLATGSNYKVTCLLNGSPLPNTPFFHDLVGTVVHEKSRGGGEHKTAINIANAKAEEKQKMLFKLFSDVATQVG